MVIFFLTGLIGREKQCSSAELVQIGFYDGFVKDFYDDFVIINLLMGTVVPKTQLLEWGESLLMVVKQLAMGLSGVGVSGSVYGKTLFGQHELRSGWRVVGSWDPQKVGACSCRGWVREPAGWDNLLCSIFLLTVRVGVESIYIWVDDGYGGSD